MPRILFAIAMAVVASWPLIVRAQTLMPLASTAASSKPDVQLVGCLAQGSDATIFILNQARRNPEDAGEKPKIYRLLLASAEANLARHVDHEVRVTGLAEAKTMKAPGDGQPIKEDKLPKFTVHTVVPVGEKCIPPTR